MSSCLLLHTDIYAQQMCFYKFRCEVCEHGCIFFFGTLPIKSWCLGPLLMNLGILTAAPNKMLIWHERSYAKWLPKQNHEMSCILCLVHGTWEYLEASMLKRLYVDASVDYPNRSQTFKMPDMWVKPPKILQGSVSPIWTPPTNHPLLTPRGRRIIQPSPAWIPDSQYCKI